MEVDCLCVWTDVVSQPEAWCSNLHEFGRGRFHLNRRRLVHCWRCFPVGGGTDDAEELSSLPLSQPETRDDAHGSGLKANSAWANGWGGAAAKAAGRPDCSAAAPVFDPVSAPF